MNKEMEEEFNNKAKGLPSVHNPSEHASRENLQVLNKSEHEAELVIGRDSQRSLMGKDNPNILLDQSQVVEPDPPLLQMQKQNDKDPAAEP